MGISKFNSEGYHDPTTYEALQNVEKEKIKVADLYKPEEFRPLVYICSPYRGNEIKNIENARRYCRFAIDNKAIPMAPHLLYPQFMDDSNPQERYLAIHTINYVLVGKCQEMWIFGDYISEGMAREIALAERRRMKIRYFTEDLEEVKR